MYLVLLATALIALCSSATRGMVIEEEHPPNECGLVGKWKNQLGSTVVFSSCQDGQIKGKYMSAVGNADDYYLLTGRYTMTQLMGDAVELGWTVSWNNHIHGNSNSVTSWTGIYYSSEKIIHTQWILTRYKPLRSLWESSMINHDEFKQIDEQ